MIIIVIIFLFYDVAMCRYELCMDYHVCDIVRMFHYMDEIYACDYKYTIGNFSSVVASR